MPRTPSGTQLREPYPRTGATSSASGRPEPARPRPRRGRARRWTLLLAVVLITAGVLAAGAVVRRGLGLGTALGSTALGVSVATSSEPSGTPSATVSQQPVLALTGTYPKNGPGTWVYAAGQGPLLGTAGTLRRFHVAVETGAPEDADVFAATVDQVLGEPRSWTAGRTLRLQRVPAGTGAEFTIYLATPGTAQRMCAAGGVDTRINGVSYVSCRTSGHVIVNLARWRESVPDFVNAKVPLDVYRQYVINHETGHELGHGHELCPGPGRPAPVMQQQTLGLQGCVAYPWPYLDGRRYQGPAGSMG